MVDFQSIITQPACPTTIERGQAGVLPWPVRLGRARKPPRLGGNKMLLAASNLPMGAGRQWATAGTVFGEKKHRRLMSPMWRTAAGPVGVLRERRLA